MAWFDTGQLIVDLADYASRIPCDWNDGAPLPVKQLYRCVISNIITQARERYGTNDTTAWEDLKEFLKLDSEHNRCLGIGLIDGGYLPVFKTYHQSSEWWDDHSKLLNAYISYLVSRADGNLYEVFGGFLYVDTKDVLFQGKCNRRIVMRMLFQFVLDNMVMALDGRIRKENYYVD